MRGQVHRPRPAPSAPGTSQWLTVLTRVINEADEYCQKKLAQAIDRTAALLNAPRADLETEAGFAICFSSDELPRQRSFGHHHPAHPGHAQPSKLARAASRPITGLATTLARLGPVPE